MKLAQGAMWSIIHDQKRCAFIYTKFKHTYNIGMLQTCNCPGLVEKALQALVCQSHLEDFYCSLCPQINMITKVDLSEATLSYVTYQAIVPKLLTCVVGHLRTSI